MMGANKFKIGSVVLLFILIAAIILIFHYRDVIKRYEDRPNFVPSDARIIEQAYRLEASHSRVPVEQVKNQDYPIVVGFPDKNCVQLTPPPNSIGGHNIYCFRNSDGTLVERYQVGE